MQEHLCPILNYHDAVILYDKILGSIGTQNVFGRENIGKLSISIIQKKLR